MEVRGVIVNTAKEFVRLRFGERYSEWVNLLPLETKNIILSEVGVDKWYPIFEGMVIPTEAICHLFYYDDYKGAWELGRFSADISLNHIYTKLFSFTSLEFLYNNAANIMYTYYRPCNIEIGILNENNKKSIFMRLIEFSDPSKYIECRIGGWLERAFEISGDKNVKIEITKSMAKGDTFTEFICVHKDT